MYTVGMDLQFIKRWEQGRDENTRRLPYYRNMVVKKKTRRLCCICCMYEQQMQGSLHVFLVSTMFPQQDSLPVYYRLGLVPIIFISSSLHLKNLYKKIFPLVIVINHVSLVSKKFKDILGSLGVTPAETRCGVTGRLAHHAKNQGKITQDWWVLEMVRCYQTQFAAAPCQVRKLHPSHYSTE